MFFRLLLNLFFCLSEDSIPTLISMYPLLAVMRFMKPFCDVYVLRALDSALIHEIAIQSKNCTQTIPLFFQKNKK
jgi:hypothetical protein